MRELSELEGAVLGVVRLRGPVTPYAVRAEFARSRSSHWSGSAGAIYPLLRRLERLGLLRSRAEAASRRAARLFAVTPAGERALRGWIGPPVEAWMASVAFDPIRTRILFFAVVEPQARRAFLRSGLQRLAEELAEARRLRRVLLGRGDSWGVVALDGAMEVLKARRRWLQRVLAAVGRGTAGEQVA